MKKGDLTSRLLILLCILVLCFSFVVAEDLDGDGYDDVTEEYIGFTEDLVEPAGDLDLGENDFLGEDDETIPDVGTEPIIDSTILEVEGFSLEKSYKWLENESLKSSDTASLAMAILALNKGYNNANLVNKLVANGNVNSQCWPAGDCKVKDTAYALLALHYVGQDVSKGLQWLNDSLISAPLSGGAWRLILESKANGSCMIGLDENNLVNYTLKDNKIGIGTANNYYVSESDLGGLSGKLMPKIYLNCGAGLVSGADLITSLNYIKNEKKIYIVEGRSGSNNEIVVPNACFPVSKGSSTCDYESTMIATWALIEMGEDLETYGSYLYLESSLNENNVLELGFVTRTLQKALLSGNDIVASYFVNNLALSQDSAHSWGGTYPTALAIFALSNSDQSEVVLSGKDYLEEQWKDIGKGMGHWDNVHDTAWALIALSGSQFQSVFSPLDTAILSGSVELCSDFADNDGDLMADCDDSDCFNTPYCLHCTNGFLDEDEEGVDCGGSCPFTCDGEINVPLLTETGIDDCFDGFDNDNDGLIDCADDDCNLDCSTDTTVSSCIADSECGPGEVCSDGVCLTEEEGGAGGIIALIIILLLLAGGGAFFYFKYVKTGKFKFGKKKSSGLKKRMNARPMGTVIPPVSRPVSKPVVTPRPVSKPVIRKPVIKDDELEKSLKKAEELLFKK